MKEVIKFITKDNVYMSLFAIIITIVIYFLLRKIIVKYVNKKNISKKRKTIFKLFKNILKYVLIVLVLIVILEINGVNVTSIVAGLGVVTLVAGLALQDALKDIIMGFNLIMDDYFSVGDVIRTNNITGKVIELGMKATKIEDLTKGGMLTIANRNIYEATVVPNWFDIDIPLPYEENIKDIEKVIDIIIKKSEKIENVDKVEYKGPNVFDSSAINYKIRIYTKPELSYQLKRDINRIIKEILDDNNICIPYTQIRLQ